MTVRRIAFCLLSALLLAAPALGQQDPAERPSVLAPLAERSLLIDLARAGQRMVAVGERGHVLYSDDEGRRWTQIVVPGSANLTAVYFADERHGWAVGHAEMILRTEDGGLSWERSHFAPDNQQPLLDVWFRDPDYGIAIGAYGTLYASNDGGRSWTLMPFEPAPLTTTAPVADPDDLDAGYSLGYDFHLNAIARAGDGSLYIAAEAGRLFRSTDDGASWRELPSPYDGSYHGILPLGGSSLLAFGLRGNLFRSDDAGRSWASLETGTVSLLNAATRVDENTVVIVGMAGTLLISRDGGSSFSLTRLDDRKAMSSVLAAADGALVVVGESGVRRLEQPR